jgi:hypothetical protein
MTAQPSLLTALNGAAAAENPRSPWGNMHWSKCFKSISESISANGAPRKALNFYFLLHQNFPMPVPADAVLKMSATGPVGNGKQKARGGSLPDCCCCC